MRARHVLALDPLDRRVGADDGTALDRPSGEERNHEERIRMTLAGAERRAGEVVREVRREVAQLGRAEEMRLEPRLPLDLLLLHEEPELVVRLADHQATGHVDVERAVELVLERLPDRARRPAAAAPPRAAGRGRSPSRRR